jgi:hypothetical protein
MREVKKIADNSLYLDSRTILRIANQAVEKAKEENKKFSIPEFFWKNGSLYYLLSNGEITKKKPEILI